LAADFVYFLQETKYLQVSNYGQYVMDFFYLLLTVLFFVVSAAYVLGCERL
jgi:hypothetical protein